jgi:hypothetical protein
VFLGRILERQLRDGLDVTTQNIYLHGAVISTPNYSTETSVQLLHLHHSVYYCVCLLGRCSPADRTQIPRSHSLASLAQSLLHAASFTPSFPLIHNLLDGHTTEQAAPLTERHTPLYTPL